MSYAILAVFWNLGPLEIGIILLVMLLLFGRRLPEVARSLGQGFVEFRKGLRDEPDRPEPLPDHRSSDPEEPDAAADEPAKNDEAAKEHEELAG